MYLQQMEAFSERKQREHDDAVTIAWLNAAFSRAAKLPKVGEFLHRKPKEEEIPVEARDAKIAAMVCELERRFTQ